MAASGHRFDSTLRLRYRKFRRRRPDAFPHGRRAQPGVEWLIGVDEAGRGPWAGPLVVAAVRLGCRVPRCLLAARDSKLLSPSRREALCDAIRARAAAVSVAWAQAAEIDGTDVLAATLAAMGRAARRAACAVPAEQCLVVVDGNRRIPGLPLEQLTVVGGDRLSLAVSCASIVAKVVRDRWLGQLDRRYPGYGLARHKGYGTAEHREALERLGPARVHRFTFAPVRRLIPA
jgi:ribonuclease HII